MNPPKIALAAFLAVIGTSAAFLAVFSSASIHISRYFNLALVGTGNVAPVANHSVIVTEYMTPVVFELIATDANPEDTLTFYDVARVDDGKLELLTRVGNGTQRYMYTPEEGFSGEDLYLFRVSDGTAYSNTGAASFVVRPPQMSYKAPFTYEDGPTAPRPPQPVPRLSVTAETVTVQPNQIRTFDLTASSTNNGDTLTFVTSQPTQGIVELITRKGNGLQTYSYKPKTGYSGADSFTYYVTNGSINSPSAKVTLNVLAPTSTPTNSPTPTPTTTPESSVTYRSYPLSVQLYAYDPAQRPAADKDLTLQQALNKYGSIRLDDADYGRLPNAPAYITLTGSQKIFGLPHTTIPAVIVQNANGAELRRVRTGAIDLRGLVKKSRFMNIKNAETTAFGATLEDNLFLDFNYGSFTFDTRSAGYLRNNRFTRIRFQAGSPLLSMKGDPTGARPSYGNVFVGFNPLTPGGDGVIIENQKDISFAGMETEHWNSLASTSESALFIVPSGGLFNAVGFNAGNGLSPVYNFNNEAFRLYGSYTDSHVPKMIVKNNVKEYVIANSFVNNVEDRSSADSFRVMEDNYNFEPRFNNALITTLTSSEQSALSAMIHPARIGQVWETPAYENVSVNALVAAPVNWNTIADQTQFLQSEYINKGKIIPPGTYYIKSSLILAPDQLLWGSGPEVTTIIAPASVDMVRSSAHRNGPDWEQANVNIGDLTLQGGRSGLRLDAAGAGEYVQVTDSVISNVVMRDMAYAGIWADGIYAMDNSFFDHVYVINSNFGWKQTYKPGCTAVEEQPGTTYLDKNYFYASQFIGNNVGWDLKACRANNSNYAINTLFKDNKIAAARMFTTTAPMFINSDFVGNEGSASTPTISVQEPIGYNWSHNTIIVGSRFDAKNADYIVGAYRIDIEGSTFIKNSNANAKLLAGNEYVSMYNNSSEIPAGTAKTGVFINNAFPGGSPYNNLVVYVKNFVNKTILNGTPTPGSQFLFGSRW
jgi:hypothetical protein